MAELTYKNSTIGLFSGHKNLKKDTLIRVEFYVNENGDEITLKAVSARTLNVLSSIPWVVIPREEYADRPEDPYDNQLETNWAFDLLGIKQ